MSRLLVKFEDFLPVVNVPRNLDPYLLNQKTLEVQEYELRPILGDSLYLDILQWEAKSLGELFKVYIKPFLIHKAYSKFVISHSVHISESGTQQVNNQYAQPASPALVQQVHNQNAKLATIDKKRLENYLHENGFTIGGKKYHKPKWCRDKRFNGSGVQFGKISPRKNLGNSSFRERKWQQRERYWCNDCDCHKKECECNQ